MREVAKRYLPAGAKRELRLARGKIRVLRIYDAFGRSPILALRYLVWGREVDNFTYDISNRPELSTFLGAALALEPSEMRRYVAELESDTQLSSEIEASLAGRKDRNSTMPFGRRVGWYAVVRAVKPRVVVETGIHDGLGSAVLLQALERNDREGSPGTLISFDVREEVGWLVPDRLRSRYERRIGDALQLLPMVLGDRTIDVFIHDSDHRYEHETAELEFAFRLRSPRAVIRSDNAHASTAFRDFCDRHDLRFFVFHEAPRGHFYPGAAIGLAVAGGPDS